MLLKRQFFEQLASVWDEQQPADRLTKLDQLLEPFNQYLRHSEFVLEVGAGTGAMSQVLLQRYPSIRLFSIDLAFAMLGLAQKRDRRAHFAQVDVHRLPFTNEIFSAVVCHNCFPHFAEKVAALEEMRRILVPGGHVLILHELSREKVNGIHQAAPSAAIHGDMLPSGNELTRQFLASGFHPLSIEDDANHYTACARK